jgi:hypothetical protein
LALQLAIDGNDIVSGIVNIDGRSGAIRDVLDVNETFTFNASTSLGDRTFICEADGEDIILTMDAWATAVRLKPVR